jgi:hypothetical protein
MRAIQPHRRTLNLYVASAPADDDEAIMLLISTLIPSPAYLCATVDEDASDSDEETETVHFLRQVGREIVIFWIPDVTQAQAAAIKAACGQIKRWGVEAFTSAVGRALGSEVQRLQ